MGKANEQAKDKPSLLNRWLNVIEKVGNKLPHPISIFAILVLFVIVRLLFPFFPPFPTYTYKLILCC